MLLLKKRRQRSQSLMNWLRNVMTFVGKMRLLLLKIRKKRAIRLIQVKGVSHIMRWIDRIRRRMRGIATETIE